MKKFVSFVLCAVLAFSLAGCHLTTPAVVLQVEDTEIPAGLYLLYQLQAYSSAASQADDQDQDVLKTTVEGVPAAQWIHNETLEGAKRYVYVTKAFEEQGLSFTEAETATMENNVKAMWENYYSELYAKNGIGEQSYRLALIADMKYSKLYEAYAEENAVSDSEAKKYMQDTYMRVRTLGLPVTDASGNAVSDEDKATIEGFADEMAAKVKAGGDFEELAEEYLKKAYELCGREFTDETTAQAISSSFMKEGGSSFSDELTAQILAAKQGEAGVTTLSDRPTVYEKIELFESDEDFETYRETIVSEINDAAYQAVLDEATADYVVTEDAAAVNAYPLKKVVLSLS